MGPLQVGTTFRTYKIERLLAESGGVILYEATDTARAQRVWIKIMQREALGNAAALARFQREAAGSKVLDVGKDDAGLPYMVATEFGPPEKPAMPPRPKPTKTTLRGVAPPPPRLPNAPAPAPEKDETEIDVEDIAAPSETPAPPIAVAVAAPELVAKPAPIPDPVVAVPEPLPLVAEPHEPRRPPLRRKPGSTTPTVFIEGRQKKNSQTGIWVAALLLVAIATGAGGWYFGHKGAHAAQATTTTTATTTPVTATTAAATVTASATETATTIPEPVVTSESKAVTSAVTPAVTATATTTATRKPRRVPNANASHPQSSDPLTL